jgi:hypothetical protein
MLADGKMEIEGKAEVVSIIDLESPDWLVDEMQNPNVYQPDWLEIVDERSSLDSFLLSDRCSVDSGVVNDTE